MEPSNYRVSTCPSRPPPSVNSWGDVASVLQKLSGLSSDRIMAVELLWTPRERGDFLTRRQMVRDYEQLTPIK